MSPERLAPPIAWRTDPSGDLVSPDGYWTLRTVTRVHLIRNGVDMGAYADRAAAQARAECEDPVRHVCRGSEQTPWRVVYDVGECQACGGWFDLTASGTVRTHPTLRLDCLRD